MIVSGERTVRLHSGSAGNVETGSFTFKKGESYTISITHVGSDRETPDYDYLALVEVVGAAQTSASFNETEEEDWIAGESGGAPSAPIAHAASSSSSGGAVIINDPQGALGDHDESSYFFAAGKTMNVYVLKVSLNISQTTMTLKHNNLSALEIVTAPTIIDFSDHEFEIRRNSESTWYSLGTGETMDWTTKVAGTFQLRAKATASSIIQVESAEKSATVQFPEALDIIQDPVVKARGAVAWQATKDATTPTSRREEGYYITLDTSDGTYGDTHTVLERQLEMLNDQLWDTATVPKPADSILNPTPLDEPTYVVGWMHTHTPAYYTIDGRWPGHSGLDQQFSAQPGIQIPGFVCDYTGNSTNYIPAGWLIDSPAEYYWVEVMYRRQL
jgi:hypothetical protein